MGSVRDTIAALLLAVLAVAAAWAQPAPHPAAPPAGVRIEGFDVEEVAALDPGTQLAFTLFGTPGAEALVRIEGAQAALRLHETQPGIYDGIYTIGPHERIHPMASVMSSLRVGDAVARARLEEPLVLGAPGSRDHAAPVVLSRADGTPAPAPAGVAPSSVAPHAADAPPPAAVAADPGALPPPPWNPPRNALPSPFSEPRVVPPPPARVPRSVACADCAVVESVEAIRPPPQAGAVGAVLGGITGALLGDRLAGHAQREWARVVGLIGGALAGHAIAKQSQAPLRYDVWLRWPDGTRQVRSYPSEPPYRVGDVLRVPRVAFAALGRPTSGD
jgi:hypothetical protein